MKSNCIGGTKVSYLYWGVSAELRSRINNYAIARNIADRLCQKGVVRLKNLEVAPVIIGANEQESLAVIFPTGLTNIQMEFAP